MTVLLAVACYPSDSEVPPFILMGSDSKLVKRNLLDDGSFEIIDTDEDFKKISIENNTLYSLTGDFPRDLWDDFPKFLNSLNTDLEDVTKKGLVFIKQYISAYPTAKCTVVMGRCENKRPEVSFIEVDNMDIKNATCRYVLNTKGNLTPIFSGATDNTEDIKEKFVTRVTSNDLNGSIMRKAVTDYLTEAATRHPESCNTKINIEILKK